MSARHREARPALGSWFGSRPLQVSSRGRSVQSRDRALGGSQQRPRHSGLLRTRLPRASARVGGCGEKKQRDEARPRGARSWRAASSARPAGSAGGAGRRGATHAPLATGGRGSARGFLAGEGGGRLRGGVSRERAAQ